MEKDVSKKIILAQIASIRASAKSCEDYVRVYPELETLEELYNDENNIKEDESDNILFKTWGNELTTNLKSYGFFHLPKVEELSISSQNKLIEVLIQEKMPYRIAMFDYLGFLNTLYNTPLNKTAIYEYIAKCFSFGKKKYDKSGRAVKGNINILSKPIKFKDKRYTANQSKFSVEKDYNRLLRG